METTGGITCGGCGKIYPWKPAYAGRSARCKCGQVMSFPAQAAPVQAAVVAAPAPEPADQPASSDDEYEIAEPVRPVRRKPAAAPAAEAETAPPLDYERARVRSKYEDDAVPGTPFRDIYAPIILIIAGFLLAFVDASMHKIHNPAITAAYILITTFGNVLIVFFALLVCVHLMGLGLGPVWTALLKIAAVAILPGAITGIISHYGFFTWSVSAVLYYALLYYLFEMDGIEIYVATAIIWLVRFVMTIALAILLFGSSASHPSDDGSATDPDAMSPNGPAPLVLPAIAPTTRPVFTKTGFLTDKESDDLRHMGHIHEAKDWFKNNPDHVGNHLTRAQMFDITNRLIGAGAKVVWAVDVHWSAESITCPDLLVQLPSDPAARKAVLAIDRELRKASEPYVDSGEPYLDIRLP